MTGIKIAVRCKPTCSVIFATSYSRSSHKLWTPITLKTHYSIWKKKENVVKNVCLFNTKVDSFLFLPSIIFIITETIQTRKGKTSHSRFWFSLSDYMSERMCFCGELW